MFQRLGEDVRYSWRHVRRAPGFASAVILTVALTIATTTTLFSLYNAMVLRTLPVSDPSRIVLLQPKDAKNQNRPLYQTSHAELQRVPVFEHLGLFSGGGLFPMEARGVKAEGLIEAASPGFHEALGLRPWLGRFVQPEDEANPDAPNVVLSHALWQRLFNGDRAAIGDGVVINGVRMTVIGVTPPEFKGLYIDSGFGFSVPMSVLNRRLGSDPKRPVRGLQAVGRLRSDVTLEQARAAIDTAWRAIRIDAVPPQLAASEREDIAQQHITVESLSSGISGLRTRYQDPLRMLLAITVILLIIGCLNLSGLMLARTAAREQQFALLLALGAPRSRLFVQVLAEGLLLATAGTLIALPAAQWGTLMLTSAIWLSSEPIALHTSLDLRALAFSTGAAIAAGVLIAALPAIRAGRQRQLTLRPERSVAHRPGLAGRALLVGQVALSLVLLVGAGLFATSLWNLRHVERGFVSELRWTRLFAVPNGYRNLNDAVYYPDLVRQIEALPEVRSVTLAGVFPTFFGNSRLLTTYAVTAAGAPPDAEGVQDVWMEMVTPRFFEVAGIPRLQGRDVSWTDAATAPGVVLINDALSRALFPNGDAIGRRIRVGTEPRRSALEVVGVVADAAVAESREPHHPMVFRPKMQEGMRAPVLIYRAASDPQSADAAIARIVASLGHEYPRGFYSIGEQLDRSLLQERLLASLSGLFAVMALVLAFVGLYGSLAYSVTLRSREIGIRLALGASARSVTRMIVSGGLVVATLGAVIGIAIVAVASRVTASLLFGVEPTNPLIVAAAAVFLVAIGAFAGLRPARRAAALDPARTLHSD
jgi:predicted permease